MSLKPFTAMFFKVFAVVAACFALCAIIGCSGAPATLEEYYDAHPEELQQEVRDFENSLSSDGFSGSRVEIKGNSIVMSGALNFDFNDIDAAKQQEMLATVSAYLEDPANAEMLAQAVKQAEDATGIHGITLTVAYTDKTGHDLGSATYGSEGIV